MPHYALADRRIYGKLATGYVGLPRPNYLEPVDLTGLKVFDGYYGPETHLFEKELAANDYFTTGKLFFQIVYLFLEDGMPFARQQILLVLNFYAITPGLAQFIQHLRTHDSPEVGKLSYQPSIAVSCYRDLGLHRRSHKKIIWDFSSFHFGPEKRYADDRFAVTNPA